ncbi:SET domain-containing protein [Balamuthia mandrillaris]
MKAEEEQREKAQEFKDQGNKAYGQGNLLLALQLYSQSLSLDDANALTYGNRSIVHLKLNRPTEALEDACMAITRDASWAKGYWHHGNALLALEMEWEARNSFARALQLAPEHTTFQQAFQKAEKLYTEKYFRADLKRRLVDGSTNVEVKYLNKERGKGVVTTKDFNYGDSIFVEIPVVSHRFVEDEEEENRIPCCSKCLRSSIPRSELLLPTETGIYELIYPGGPPKFVQCPHCNREQYCGEGCRQMAWDSYHEVMCVGGDNPDHPLLRLEKIAKYLLSSFFCTLSSVFFLLFTLFSSYDSPASSCVFSLSVLVMPFFIHYPLAIPKQREHQRTNPLMIARAFGIVAQQCKRTGCDPKRAFEPFANFISNQEPSPQDEESVQLIQEALVPSGDNSLRSVINLENFRLLNGAILRNAQTIAPVSDLHTFLVTSPPSVQNEIMATINNALRKLFKVGQTNASSSSSSQESNKEEKREDEQQNADDSETNDKESSTEEGEGEREDKTFDAAAHNKKVEEELKQLVGKRRFDSPLDLLESPIAKRLMIKGGSGLFAIANCMNHSCQPNAIVVSCFNSEMVRVVAIPAEAEEDEEEKEGKTREEAEEEEDVIRRGTELCFSYIDETLGYKERQRQLQQYYLFRCRCPKCVREAAEEEQEENET